MNHKFVLIVFTNGDFRMKDKTIYRGTISRRNIMLSLLVVAFSFASASAQSIQNSYADLVNRVAPAVVTIRSTERARAAQQFPFTDDPTLREFFGDRMPQQQQQPPPRVQGVGSGVI